MQTIFNTRTFTRENVRDRMLKHASELWAVDEGKLEQFDPLVRLLIEACAVEFENSGREIRASEGRLMEKLAGLLCGEGGGQVRPAYAVAYARPLDAAGKVSPETTMVYNRKVGGDPPVPVFFSPVASFPMVQGTVRYISNPAGLFKVSERTHQKSFASGFKSGLVPDSDVWIGLDLDQELFPGDGMRFFFNSLQDTVGKTGYLHGARWTLGDKALRAEWGLDLSAANVTERGENPPWGDRFVQVSGAHLHRLGEYRCNYPEDFTEKFDTEVLDGLNKPLAWLRVCFARAVPAPYLNSLDIVINAFPVMNARLNRISYRLQKGLNGIQLPSSETFYAIHSVSGQSGKAYAAVDRAGPENGQLAGKYAIRRSGMGRLDEKSAKAALYDLLDLLKDEQSAFSSLGEDFLNALLREMAQNIARLEQKMGARRTHDTTSHPFLVLESEKDSETVYIDYWTTLAEVANGIPGGTPLSLYGGAGATSVSGAALVTTTFGGRPVPAGRELVNELRTNLTTGGRLVTAEDIKVFCKSELGVRLKEVSVKNGFAVSSFPGEGFVKCIHIELRFSDLIQEEEWTMVERELLSRIAARTSGVLPYRIVKVH